MLFFQRFRLQFGPVGATPVSLGVIDVVNNLVGNAEMAHGKTTPTAFWHCGRLRRRCYIALTSGAVELGALVSARGEPVCARLMRGFSPIGRAANHRHSTPWICPTEAGLRSTRSLLRCKKTTELNRRETVPPWNDGNLISTGEFK